jgi:SAM-dependent methyltransferase
MRRKGPVSSTRKALYEWSFDFPRLYNLFVRGLGLLSGIRIYDLDTYTKGKSVLDIGCGSYQRHYHPESTSRRVGIDPSESAIIRARELYPRSDYLVSDSPHKTNLESKSFDYVLLLFTIHHLPLPIVSDTLKEANRLASEEIIVYDHVLHSNRLLSAIQSFYWKTLDGGTKYRTLQEWKTELQGYEVLEFRNFGAMFKNICFFRIRPLQPS